ncbi:MAG: HpcH/HpaI aldolase family protein [Hyphomicrobiales bacterium]
MTKPEAHSTGGPALAFWLETGNFAACEIAKLLGYDAVILDYEHGVISRSASDRILQGCAGLGLKAYTRVAAVDRVAIQHALDSGATGVIIPQIASLADAERACALAKYPPLGSRGLGYSRISDYGPVDDAFVERQNRMTLCVPMIETPGALAEVESIAALPTVDALFIGPSDLSLTRGRGVYGQRDADFEDMAKIADAADRAGKRIMLPAPSDATFGFAVSRGASLVTISDDLTALQVGLADAIRRLRAGPPA